MKKTTKELGKETQTVTATADITQLDLTKATKETNEYYYRTDGTLYGHKNIKEQVDQAGFGSAKLESAITAKKEVTLKESRPSKTVIWVGVIVFTIVLLVIILFYLLK
ncbi:hypothetical protein ACXZ1K_16100 [Pedobacter sp. PWIIR3]